MNPQFPIYITGLLILIVFILVSAIFYALNYGLNKLDFTAQKKQRVIIVSAILLGGWLIVSALVAFQGTLLDFTSTPPKMLLILIPSILAVIYISSSSGVNKLLTVIPSSWLVYIQSFRVLMEVFYG